MTHIVRGLKINNVAKPGLYMVVEWSARIMASGVTYNHHTTVWCTFSILVYQ